MHSFSYPQEFLRRLALLSLAMVAPLFLLFLCMHAVYDDAIIYATELDLFSRQFWAGELYPRWLTDADAGLGSGLFLFNAPLPYYLGALFAWLSPLDPHGFYRLCLSMIAALMIGGLTSYHWLTRYFPHEQAQKGALLYIGFPYIFTIIYLSFGLSHLVALALFPFLLASAHDMTRDAWKSVPRLAAGYALLALTHLPSLMLFCAIPFLYVLVFAPKNMRGRCLGAAIASALLGAGLAAIHILPLLANTEFISSGHYSHVFNKTTLFYGIRSLLGFFLVIIPLMGLYAELPRTMKKIPDAHARFFIASISLLFLLVLPVSQPLWNATSLMDYVQYPARLFIPMLPLALYLSVLWLPHVKTAKIYKMMSGFAMVILVLCAYHTSFYPSLPPIVKNTLEQKIITPNSFSTIWVPKNSSINKWELPEFYEQLPGVSFLAGAGNAQITQNSSRTIALHADISNGPATLMLRRHYFPGWQGSAKIGEHRGVLTLDLPQGRHDITLTLPWFAGEREGVTISLLAALALLFLCFTAKTRKQHD